MRAGRKPASAFGAVAAAMVMTTVLAAAHWPAALWETPGSGR